VDSQTDMESASPSSAVPGPVKRPFMLATLPDARRRGAARIKWFPHKVTPVDCLLAVVTKAFPLKVSIVPADGMRELFDYRGVAK
jgi:hypothetical protein